jgi:hypothetical protein
MSNWQRIPRIHRRQGNRRAVRERTEGCVQTTCLSSGALRAPTFDMSASHSCRRGSIQIPRGFVPTYHIDLENVSTPTGVSQSTTADYKPADAGRSRQRRFDDSELPPDGRMLLRGGRGRTTRGQRHETELGNGGHAGCPLGRARDQAAVRGTKAGAFNSAEWRQNQPAGRQRYIGERAGMNRNLQCGG